MTSLYDKFHSQKNINHIYNLIDDLIQQKIGKSNGWRGFLLNMKIPYRSDLYELENNLNVISLICKIHTNKISFFPKEFEI